LGIEKFLDAVIPDGIRVRNLMKVPVSITSFDKPNINLDAEEERELSIAVASEYGDSLATLVNAKVIESNLVPKIVGSKATVDNLGTVKPDGVTITIDNGVLTSTGAGGSYSPDGDTIEVTSEGKLRVLPATETSLGIVQPDNSLRINKGILGVPLATSVKPGIVRSDEKTIKVENGVLSAVKASVDDLGVVKPDGSTIFISDGVISAPIQYATSSTSGMIQPGSSLDINADGIVDVPFATDERAGVVRSDGRTVFTEDGVLSAYIPKADDKNFGISRPDNTSIIINEGILSIAGGAAGYAPDFVTIDVDLDQHLEAVTATADRKGIVKPDGRTITIMDGVITAQRPFATKTTPGVVMVDEDTVEVKGGVLSATGVLKAGEAKVANSTATFGKPNMLASLVKTEGEEPKLTEVPYILPYEPDMETISFTALDQLRVEKATADKFGVVKPDGGIIQVDQGNITVAKATSESFGVVKPDGVTLTVNDGVMSSSGDKFPSNNYRDLDPPSPGNMKTYTFDKDGWFVGRAEDGLIMVFGPSNQMLVCATMRGDLSYPGYATVPVSAGQEVRFQLHTAHGAQTATAKIVWCR
jgi:hypothetical protein